MVLGRGSSLALFIAIAFAVGSCLVLVAWRRTRKAKKKADDGELAEVGVVGAVGAGAPRATGRQDTGISKEPTREPQKCSSIVVLDNPSPAVANGWPVEGTTSEVTPVVASGGSSASESAAGSLVAVAADLGTAAVDSNLAELAAAGNEHEALPTSQESPTGRDAGSGLRIGEALAIHIGGSEDQTRISPDCRTIFVRKSIWGGVEQEPKTKDAIREVDLCEPLAKFIKDFIGNRKDGYLFCSDSGRPLLQRNILRDSLHRIQKGRKEFQSYRTVGTQKVKHILFLAIPGVLGHTEGFHAFRRYRATHLDLSDVPRGIAQFWLGHADKTITDRYVKMQGRIEERRTWAERAGLGFKLPKKLISMKRGKAA